MPNARLSGPKGRPLFGHLADFRADRLSFFTRCAREHGDVVPLRLAGYRVLLLNRPDLVEEALVAHAGRSVKHFGLRLYKPILGNGLVTSEGPFWRRQRKLSAPAFQPARIAGYADAMTSATVHTAEAWRAAAGTGAAGTAAAGGASAGASVARDVHADTMRLTLDIACRTLFGADACPDPERVGRAMDEALAAVAARFATLVPWPTWIPTPANRRLRRSVRALRAVVAGLIARRRATGPGDDLLWVLLKARDEDATGSNESSPGKAAAFGKPASPAGMSDVQLVDEALTQLLAGHETTALTLSYALYLLAGHPAAQAALRAELTDVLGDRTPTHADLAKLPYLKNVVTEAMRLYPPADVLGRELTEDATVGGMPVRRGTTLFVSQWVMHRDARYFPDPLRFDPARWTPAFARALPKFAYFPFGGGPRACVGQTFATAEAALVLAVLCRRFEFTPDPAFRLELDPGITLRPRDGVRVFVRPVDV